MRFSVCSHAACPVDGKYYRQVLHAHVLHHLVKTALQERRIYGYKRLHSCLCHSSGKGDCVFFGDSHIEESVRKPLGKFAEACGFTHGCSHGRNS